MAGADRVYDAALKQCGAIRVHTIEEMFDFCKAYTEVPPLARPRIAIVTNSGGPGVMAADRAEEVGLAVAEPSAKVQAALGEFLPGHCAVKNPIDLTVEGTEEWYRRTLSAVLEAYDAALAINVSTPYLDSLALARGVADAAEGSDKPLVAAFLPERIVAESVDYLQERGVPNFATGERAVAALARVANIAREQRRRGAEEQGGKGVSESAIPNLPVDQSTSLPTLEPEAMAWLEENGIPVPQFRFAKSNENAVRSCRELGYPVAMKVVSPQILHKSDVGGVILDVGDDEQVCRAFERLREVGSGRDFRGVVIYPMIEEAQEVLLGLSRDPQFGPVVAFGLGGIYTELWQDVALRVAPIDHAEAARMIREIESFPLLEGLRGQPPCDLDALAEVLVRFSQLPFQYPALRELDLNPVFLFEEGRGLLVGDVRVITDSHAKERHS
jgi:acetyltransferase